MFDLGLTLGLLLSANAHKVISFLDKENITPYFISNYHFLLFSLFRSMVKARIWMTGWAGGLKAVWMKAEKHLSVGSVSMHPHWVRRCDAS